MRLPSCPAPLTAVGLISASALAYEILLIRVFAIVHWHHLVATAISLALLGYGASGTFLAIAGPWLRSHFAPAFLGNAVLFSISSLACVDLAQRLAFDPLALTWEWSQWSYLAGTFLLLAIPFFAAANCIGLVLWHFRDEIPRVYGVDLIGAGLGGMLVVGGLAILTPSGALFGVFCAGILASVSAALTLRWHLYPVAIGGLLLAIAVWTWGQPDIRPAPYKDLARALSTIGATIDYQASGVAGTVSVLRNERVPVRQAPGLSLHTAHLPPRQLAVFVDGDAAGALGVFSEAPGASAYLMDLTSALPYVLLDSPRVAVLNAGVGLAVQQGLSLGAASIAAIQPNPLLHVLACERYASESAEICDPNRVSWHVQAARAFLARNTDNFDLITLTLDSDAAGLNALRIDFDLTRQAFLDYLQHLAPGGLLSIEGPTRTPPRLSLRVLNTARAALQEKGIESAGLHLAMIRGWQRFVLLVSNEPFGPAQEAAIRAFADSRGFDLIWLPNITAADANRYQQLSEPQYYLGAATILGRAVETPHLEDRFRLQAASDDTPFPYRFSRWTEFWSALVYGDRNELSQLDTGLFIGSVTLLLVTAAGTGLILFPLLWLRLGAEVRGTHGLRARTFAYFGLVGIAFLFMEIAWIQRLQLFLGHPVFATSAVLIAFLVFAGLGSLWSQRHSDRRDHRLLVPAVLTILFFSLVYVWFLPPVLAELSHLPIAARVFIVLAMLAPLAFAMGIPFPSGLRALGQTAAPLIPWAWGINGCASVASAASAPLLAMEIGFNGLIGVAVMSYLLVPLIQLERP
ncbi:MAG: hypothetical protein WBM81_03645 [Sedimenticolaceae bacterium]